MSYNGGGWDEDRLKLYFWLTVVAVGAALIGKALGWIKP